VPSLSPQSLKCTGRGGFPRGPLRRMMTRLMKRIAHAVSGIGEKPALLTEGGLLLALILRLRKTVAGGDQPLRVNPDSREQHDERQHTRNGARIVGQATFKFVADSLPLFRSASTS
jgi:hypothetical protein